MSLSPDGNRGYIADTGGELTILDTSEIQARKPNPQAREISRLTWRGASIPQNAIPFTVSGKPYLLETDEYTQGTTGGGNSDEVGAARIIDISDERKPQGGREPAPPGEPARRPREGRERPRREQPGAGLRRPLLRRLDPEGPDGGRVLVHRLRPARVRHQRPDQAEGDRLLRAAVENRVENGFDGSTFAMSKPAVVPEPPRGLVQRRRTRLLQPAREGRGLARRRARRAAWRAGRRSGRATSAACGSGSRARSFCAACPRRGGAPGARGAGA